MRSSAADGLLNINRNCRQSSVAIITILLLPRRCQCNPRLSLSDLVARTPNSGVTQGSYHPVFLSSTFRATSITCMRFEGATFRNKNRFETQEKYG